MYRKSLKHVLGLSQNTPSAQAYHVAGVISPEMLIHIRFLGVAKRLLDLRSSHLDPWIRKKIELKVSAFKLKYQLDRF